MDRDGFLKEIEAMAAKLNVQLYDVKATLPSGETRILKVVPYAYQYILDKFSNDNPGTVYEIPDCLLQLKK